MVRSSSALALFAIFSATLFASSQQTTTQQPPPAKPPVTKPATPQAKPTTPPAKPPASTTKPATPAPAAAKPAPEPPKPATDVRFKTVTTQGPQVSENVTYLQGPRQRVEFPGVVNLEQCDLKRSVLLNTAAKKYRIQPYSEIAAASASSPAVDPATQQAKPGVVTMMTTLTDTLERQPMYGLEARHVKTTVVKQMAGSVCDKTPFKMEIDAWYVDLPEQSQCVRPTVAPPSAAGGCTDRVEAQTVGDVKLGFPVKLSTTTVVGDGDKAVTTTAVQEVSELSITRLEKSLFEVPGDYAEAKSTAEIVPSIAKGGGIADALFGSTADGSSTAAPKKSGVTRIGVLEPVNKTDKDLYTGAMRTDLVSKFSKSGYEALPLSGSSPAEADDQAAKLGCDYVVLAEVTEVKVSKPNKIGGMLNKASGSTTKDNTEVKVDYKLFPVGSAQNAKISGTAKGSNGGFGVGSALKLAAFAGQMYLTMMTGGMGMGMMNPMMGMAGGMGGGGGRYFDPRAMAMTSVFSGLGGSGMGGMPGMPGAGTDPSDADMRDTVSEALGNAAKATMDQINKPAKK